MSEIFKERVYGNFKPTAKQKLKAKKAKKKDKRPGMSDEHCANIRQLACINCNWPQSEVHHLKCTGERGAGLRSTDKWGVPLCHDCHINGVEKVGSRKEINWFQSRGIDCLALAAALWSNRHDFEAMKRVRDTHYENKSGGVERRK